MKSSRWSPLHIIASQDLHGVHEQRLDLKVAVADPKFGVCQACGDVGVDLGIYVRVDPDHDAGWLTHALRSRCDVVKVKLAVTVDQHLLLYGKPQLRGQLPVAVEDRPEGFKTLQSSCQSFQWREDRFLVLNLQLLESR